MAKAPPPNYTQSPNVYFDTWLREIDSLAELKVVNAVMRHTFGWHEKETQLSFTELQEVTGLSRSSLSEGVKRALKHGYIERAQGTERKVCSYRMGVGSGSNSLPVEAIESGTESLPDRKSSGSETQPDLVVNSNQHLVANPNHLLIDKEIDPKERKKKDELTFIDGLKTNPAYAHIDIDLELHKMKAWLALPRNKNRQLTPRFVLNWLNKIERPLNLNGHEKSQRSNTADARGNVGSGQSYDPWNSSRAKRI